MLLLERIPNVPNVPIFIFKPKSQVLTSDNAPDNTAVCT